MERKNLVLWFFNIFAFFGSHSIAHEAIVGGREVTDLKPYRYMVSLLKVGHGHLCGGALIGEQAVVTAAHCFINRNNNFENMQVFALLGTKNLLDMNFPTVNVEVVKVYVPIEYDATNIDAIADIAVLRLSEPVHLRSHRNIKVVKQVRNRFDSFSGKKAVISGWGWNHVEMQNNQAIGHRTDSMLQFAMVDVIDNDQCQHDHPEIKIFDEHLCAKVEQHDHDVRGVCHGDDGNPLVYDGTLIGILSNFPNNCSERPHSAIYTRVAYYVRFMRNAKADIPSRNIRIHVLRP